MVGSTALEIENSLTPNEQRRIQAAELLSKHTQEIHAGPPEIARMDQLIAAGIKQFDALHLACAESAKCDVFLTTDDRLLRKAKALGLIIRVDNPLDWLREVLAQEQGNGRH
jgi:predicted nucleic acid-binding protein